MSRIGIKPVQVPQGVKVTVGPDLVTVEGPKGKLTQSYVREVEIAVKGAQPSVGDEKVRFQAGKGLSRALSQPRQQHGDRRFGGIHAEPA